MTKLEREDKGKQVKSKKRVNDHGEVFTAEREVNAMLDLVKQETERIDSRFLEPACGNGNFLAEVLRRKLAVVEDRYAKSQIEFERYSCPEKFCPIELPYPAAANKGLKSVW